MINRYALAGLLAVLTVFGIGALAFVVFGGEDPPPQSDATAADTSAPAPTATGTATATATPTAVAKLPKQRTKNLTAAARRAGCVLLSAPDEGAEHVTRALTPLDYETNPPTSGVHAPVPALDQIYPPGGTPDLGTLVHSLEHGRINLQYRPGTSATTIAQLEALYKELDGGHHLLVYENQTEMLFAIAATAWHHLLGCYRMNDKVFDALRAFTATYVDKGPETVP